VRRHRWIRVTLAVVFLLSAGCDRLRDVLPPAGRSPSAGEGPADEPTPEPGRDAETPAPASAPSDTAREQPLPTDLSLSSACTRVSRFVLERLEDYRRRRLAHGLLVPDRHPLVVVTAKTGSIEKAAVANRVRSALVDALATLKDVSLLGESAPNAATPTRPKGRTLNTRTVPMYRDSPNATPTLTVDVLTTFEGPFDAFRCVFELRLGGKTHRHYDRFDSEGLVCIGPEDKVKAGVVVRLDGEDSKVISFRVAGGRPFLVPCGRYRKITVRYADGTEGTVPKGDCPHSKDAQQGDSPQKRGQSQRYADRTWSPPVQVVGLHNIYDVSSDSRPSVPPAAAPAGTVRPVPTARPRAPERGRPRLTILDPVENQKVSRITTIRGESEGLTRANGR